MYTVLSCADVDRHIILVPVFALLSDVASEAPGLVCKETRYSFLVADFTGGAKMGSTVL